MLTIKLGYRHYEINKADEIAVRAIWANTVGTQDDFEVALELAGIDYAYDLLDFMLE